MTIVKVQVALASPGAPWMIYANGRVRMQMLPDRDVPAELRRAMGDDKKGYFAAVWKRGSWQIGERVPDQDW